MVLLLDRLRTLANVKTYLIWHDIRNDLHIMLSIASCICILKYEKTTNIVSVSFQNAKCEHHVEFVANDVEFFLHKRIYDSLLHNDQM